MTDKELIRVVKSFTKGILGGRPTTDMCYMVCSPLQAYLRAVGVECTLTEGELNGLYQHFWLTLSDGRIIDPTADQFGLLNIYVRKQLSYYKAYTSEDYNQKISDAVIKFENCG